MGEDLDRSSSPGKDPSTITTRKISVHQSLGGGPVADVLLWKRRSAGVFLLLAASTVWFLFERAGHSLLSLVANVLLLLVVILFFWAKSASLLNRPLPPLPNLEVSEDFVGKVADASRDWINHVLAIAHNIALGRDAKLFAKVVVALWLVSYVGGLFSFLTLVYIGIVLALSVPALYDRYQDRVDEKLCATHKVLLTWYRQIDSTVLSRIPLPSNKEKKTQ
ncbi:reticulon-like protein B11 [Magnolia sinica]|uniref:reticulon-like protein B11 n=1 Tax=Magnolia sinica TaxID=86752 RepID=UPI002657CB99|nr:reticulon-like protein B11 [Magnolia sinica]